MDRRTFLKGMGLFSAGISIHPKSIVTGLEERYNGFDDDGMVMWCRIDTYRSDLRRAKDWDTVERMVDDKLANAKITMMELFRENYDPDKVDS